MGVQEFQILVNFLKPHRIVTSSTVSRWLKGHLSISIKVCLRFIHFNQPQACNFIKKEALAQVFSCEFCEISKNTFFTEHLWAIAAASILNI